MKTKEIYGIYDDDSLLLSAIKDLKEKGYRVTNAYTPFPVHGLDDALEIKYSRLPYVAFGAGLTGTITAIFMQVYTMVIDWPVDIGGKPHFAWPSFVPITFELTVLFSALGMVAAFLYANGLYPGKQAKIIHPRQTDDHFVLVIEADNNESAIADVKGALQSSGAVSLQEEEHLQTSNH